MIKTNDYVGYAIYALSGKWLLYAVSSYIKEGTLSQPVNYDLNTFFKIVVDKFPKHDFWLIFWFLFQI